MGLITRLRLCCKYKYKTCKIPHLVGVKWCSSSASVNGEVKVDVELENKILTLATGKMAKIADGCALVTFRNTTVMGTVVSKNNNQRISLVPLTVTYQQKAAALGRIPLTSLRREMGQTEQEILTSRLIDRSIRPLFPAGFSWDTQIICSPLAMDGSNMPDVLAVNAASAALAVSDVPWDGPVGAVRVGLIDGQPVLNPTRQEMAKSQMNLVVATRKNKFVTMIECAASCVEQNDLFRCLKEGVKGCVDIVIGIENLARLRGKEKREFVAPKADPGLLSAVQSLCSDKLRSILQDHGHNKLSRDEAITAVQTEVLKELKDEHGDQAVANVFTDVLKQIFRDLIFETEIRCDGRKLSELRKITCEVDLYEPLHGSALFQRGQTQVLCTVALDSPNSALRIDRIHALTSGVTKKNFFVHYEFPPFATNEAKRLGPRGRREIGHGALAEKALQSVVPENFPFAIRLTSEVLESNGSSSMATVCGGSLALMDAGVPIEKPCAGVAMGLLSRRDGNGEVTEYKILTDLLGIEDYFGETDFKIAGTKKAYTAIQLDVKCQGIPLQIIYEMLIEAKHAMQDIFNIMREACPRVRVKKKENWPETKTVRFPVHLRSKFLGPGGINVKKLEAETGVEFTEEDLGVFSLFAPNKDALAEAEEMVSEVLKANEEQKLEFGGVYSAQITEIKASGCLVSLFPNMRPEYIPLSQLDIRQVNHPSALGLQEGQEIWVKYFGRDPVSGSMRLSRKALQGPASEVMRSLNREDPSEKEKADKL